MQRLYPRIALFLLVVAVVLVVLLAVGVVEFHIPSRAKAVGEGTSAAPEPRISRVDAEKYLKPLAWEATVFEYSGAFLECWIEVEADGKTEIIGKELGGNLKGLATAGGQALDAASVRGYVIWIRRTEAGQDERWDLGVSAGREGEENAVGSYLRNIAPPPLKSLPGQGRGGGHASASGGTLRPGQEIELDTITVDQVPKQGAPRVRRTARLKCRLLAAEEEHKK